MLGDSILEAYKLDCMVAIQSKSWMTQTTKIRPHAHQNMHKSFTKLSQNHAKNTCYNMMHVKVKTWDYKTSVWSIHGMSNPT